MLHPGRIRSITEPVAGKVSIGIDVRNAILIGSLLDLAVDLDDDVVDLLTVSISPSGRPSHVRALLAAMCWALIDRSIAVVHLDIAEMNNLSLAGWISRLRQD